MIKYRAKIKRKDYESHLGVKPYWIYSNEGDGDEYSNIGAFFNKVAVYNRANCLLVPPQMWTGYKDKDDVDIYFGADIRYSNEPFTCKVAMVDGCVGMIPGDPDFAGSRICIDDCPTQYLTVITDNPELSGGKK